MFSSLGAKILEKGLAMLVSYLYSKLELFISKQKTIAAVKESVQSEDRDEASKIVNSLFDS